MDGVLADFDRGVFELMGKYPEKMGTERNDKEMWDAVHAKGDFFLGLKTMPGIEDLWFACDHLNPTVLTGIPKSVPGVPDQKRAWVKQWLGSHVPVITCFSKDKIFHAKKLCKNGEIPVLIDDWDRYKPVWEDNGGVFILHISPKESYNELKKLGVL